MANDSKTWRCGKYELSFDRPRIMGVLNVTPDSFSDGGEHFDRMPPSSTAWRCSTPAPTSSTWRRVHAPRLYPG